MNESLTINAELTISQYPWFIYWRRTANIGGGPITTFLLILSNRRRMLRILKEGNVANRLVHDWCQKASTFWPSK
ncbi:hypothetical protein B0G84_6361 [Paraburkholderia sp. BL8N3]|jgi:hypothetical protein|nr:hypothetical protein B0G84_6361 [Paraburkholderia sp. BL8N3]